MQTTNRQNGVVKPIMKKKPTHDDMSTGDVDEEDDSFADESDSGGLPSSIHDEDDDDVSSVYGVNVPSNRKAASQIAGRETKFVLCSKTMAYLVLLLSSIACGTVTYFFIEDEEQDSFQKDVRPFLLASIRFDSAVV